MVLRFAVVTDIHYGFDSGKKKGSRAPKLMDRFVRVANTNAVDFSIDLGDRISLSAPDKERHYLGQLTDHFNQRSSPHYSIYGNHDLYNLTRADHAAAIGRDGSSQIIHTDQATMILWSPNTNGRDGDGYLSAWQSHIDWLEKALAAATGPCVVFSHVPLDNTTDDDKGIQLGENKFFPGFYVEGANIRKIMEDSGKVILCMAGHRHRNRHQDINGIHYITQQSLVQRHRTLGRAIGAFSVVAIDDTQIKITGYGIRQPDYTLPRHPQ